MKLTVTTFVSVDGVMQGPGAPDEDRSGGFQRGGWLAPLADDETGQFMHATFQRVDAFLLGRRTYDIFAGYWPRVLDPDDPIASQLNALPKYVPSTTLTDPEWSGTTVLTGDVAGAIRDLKSQQGRELQVHGSATLVRFLLDNDLVDELNLLTFPVIVGQGMRLFADRGVDLELELAECRSTPKGVTIQTYRTAGRPEYGTVGE
ncbi:dihydrofolate reductase family protein [Saccharopolyspora mangrovi]|uniref:Dihydrofolate reductase family protein n=1 Tax=Saccharopolyspora mangrovi TaxID=3082379 RepID=A0ABU6A757_9PSEU|nr:dihydrofolate reductase family protein [Saccharopolyspora sp. S2-29]MEB3367341.1 dihydrofolate reductase family protein [Saccharopolyspora sp. S2-29]